jgi:catalase
MLTAAIHTSSRKRYSLLQVSQYAGVDANHCVFGKDGTFKYIKIHIKAKLGVKNLDRETATKVAGENPDFLVQDLFDSIEREDYPEWNVFVQTMEPSQAERYKWNIFDMTKVWPHQDFPLRQIGRLTLNQNVSPFFDRLLIHRVLFD